MTIADPDQLISYIDTRMARVEGHLAGVVNERTTRVIDATTAIVSGLHDDLRATTEAVQVLSENIVERRVYIDERLTLLEGHVATLADLIPGAAEALGHPPLRQLVEANARETRRIVWWIVAGLIAVELVQWIVMILVLR
jgi:tetrahydromethanopterin S-methyltransferase subunit B